MMGDIVTAYIGLGSNLESPRGDRSRHLELAAKALSGIGEVTNMSSVYETTPWDVTDRQPDYLNAVAALSTAMDPSALVTTMLGIETDLGRERSEKNGSRVIDLDVLLFGNNVINRTGVQIPHPRLHERAFVLVPLAEINTTGVHPIFGITISELLSTVDISGVRRYGDAPSSR